MIRRVSVKERARRSDSKIRLRMGSKVSKKRREVFISECGEKRRLFTKAKKIIQGGGWQNNGEIWNTQRSRRCRIGKVAVRAFGITPANPEK